MGQKVHPYGFRLGFNKPWRSRWFAKQGYAKLLQEDLELKAALTDTIDEANKTKDKNLDAIDAQTLLQTFEEVDALTSGSSATGEGSS